MGSRKGGRHCPVCRTGTKHKRVFKDEVAARVALATMTRVDHGNKSEKVPTRVYACPRGHGWHMTSEEKHNG